MKRVWSPEVRLSEHFIFPDPSIPKRRISIYPIVKECTTVQKKRKSNIWKNKVERTRGEKKPLSPKEGADTRDIMQKIKFEFIKPSSNTFKSYSKKIKGSADVWNTLSENREVFTVQIDKAKEDVIQVVREYLNQASIKGEGSVNIKSLFKHPNIFKAFLSEKLLLKKQIEGRKNGNFVKNPYLDEMIEVLTDPEYYKNIIEIAMNSQGTKLKRKQTTLKTSESYQASPDEKISAATNSIKKLKNMPSLRNKTLDTTIGSSEEISLKKVYRPPQRVDTVIDMNMKIPVRKDTHMKISNYMRKKIKFRGHRESIFKRNRENRSDNEEEKQDEVERVAPRQCFSSSILSRDLLPEVQSPEPKIELNNTFKNPRKKKIRVFRNKKYTNISSIMNNKDLYDTLCKLSCMKPSIPAPKAMKGSFQSRHVSPEERVFPEMSMRAKIKSVEPRENSVNTGLNLGAKINSGKIKTKKFIKEKLASICTCQNTSESITRVNQNTKIASLLAKSHKRTCPVRTTNKKDTQRSRTRIRRKLDTLTKFNNTFSKKNMKF